MLRVNEMGYSLIVVLVKTEPLLSSQDYYSIPFATPNTALTGRDGSLSNNPYSGKPHSNLHLWSLTLLSYSMVYVQSANSDRSALVLGTNTHQLTLT